MIHHVVIVSGINCTSGKKARRGGERKNKRTDRDHRRCIWIVQMLQRSPPPQSLKIFCDLDRIGGTDGQFINPVVLLYRGESRVFASASPWRDKPAIRRSWARCLRFQPSLSASVLPRQRGRAPL